MSVHLEIAVESLVVLALLLVSAGFSGAETALYALGHPTLERWRTRGTPRQQMVARLMSDHQTTLATLLLGNTFINVVISVLCARLAGHLVGGAEGVLAAGLVATLVIMLVGEVTPKCLAYAKAPVVAPLVAPLVSRLRTVLAPLTRHLRRSSEQLLPLLGGQSGSSAITVEEYETYVTFGRRLGAFNAQEEQLLQQVFKLRHHTAAEVMTPRVDLDTVDASWDAATVAERLRDACHRRLPVVAGNLDRVVGILDGRRFAFATPADQARWVQTCVEPPLYLPELARLNQVLSQLRQRELAMALLVDEYGGIAGLITLDDVIEQLVGEQPNEYDGPAFTLARLGPQHWRANGLMPVRAVLAEVPLDLPEHSADTIGGLLLEGLGHLPGPREAWVCGSHQLVAHKLMRHRVLEVDIIAAPPPAADPAAALGDDDDDEGNATRTEDEL